MRFNTIILTATTLLATLDVTTAGPVGSAIFGGIVALIGGVTEVIIHARHPGKRDNIQSVKFQSRNKRQAPATVADTGPNALAWQECVSQLGAPGTAVAFTFSDPGCK